MSNTLITFCGDDALRLNVPDRTTRFARARQLEASGYWAEVVPGRRDITVQFDPHAHTPDEAMQILTIALRAPLQHAQDTPQTVTIPVQFGGKEGPDLARIAANLKLTADEVVARLVEHPLQVDMLGFTPGFAYMSGLTDDLEIPRLAQPRQQVPGGSIGLITGQCGLYSLPGPGGWPIIGRTALSLFDVGAEQPFRLQPGMRVKLVDAGAP